MAIVTPRGLTADERFWRHVNKTTTCWTWSGANKNGYGIFRLSGRNMTATHYALTRQLGRDLLPGHIVAHHCDNPPCVRPDHLFETTHAGNIADKLAKGRGRFRNSKGTRNPRAVLTDADVQEMRRLYDSSDLNAKQVALQFGIDPSHGWKIVTRKIWTHI